MKNFIKADQKLPLFGIGPYLIWGMLLIDVLAVILAVYVFRIGTVDGAGRSIFWGIGALLIILGITIWVSGALRSGMKENISENKLKTDGIYAWVRNPMYSGLWILFTGVTFLWNNVPVLVAIPVNWLLMTAVLSRTEERWLLDLYGEEYETYKRSVNRCIPWKRA